MRKALLITMILLLFTVSIPMSAIAQKRNIIINQTTETIFVVYSTKYGAQGAVPAGYQTKGWKTIVAGEQKTFWAYDPHKIYFQIWKGLQRVKPTRSTQTFAFWIHRDADFNIVTQQEINASITRAQLVYSSHDTSLLTQSDGFLKYNNGSQITVTNTWVDVNVEGVDPNALVNIPDPNLRAAIEKALGKAQGDTISQTDMLTLTSLDIPEIYTEDLTGLEFGINLRQLNLSHNWIEDISPLASLESLTSLDLSENTISDISPLASLGNLTSLNLKSVPIEDISPLAGLKTLTSLNLENVPIEDVSILSGLTNLTILNLAGVPIPIEDIAPLASLTNLTKLNLSENSISDVSPLASLTNLTELNLSYNSIEDISPLASLTNLTTLDLSNYKIEDIAPLASLTNLTELNLSENSISDVSPLAGLTNLRELDLSYNQISDFFPIAHLIPNLETYHSGNQYFSTVAVDPEAPVDIPDPVLRAAIENELGKSPGTIITQAEMATLTSFSFDSSEASIQDLAGLEFAINLEGLYLKNNKILEVAPLTDLKNLTWLDLSGNLISDVSALVNLNNLIWLDLSLNPYTYSKYDTSSILDVTPIAQLKNLTYLKLSRNRLSDISPLAALKNLGVLDLWENRILDISPLAGLKNLTELHLGSNSISDISSLAGLENLTALYLSNNQISDFSPIAHLIPNLETYENKNQSSPVVNPGAPVHIPDLKLRTAIEKELGKPPGTTITQAEMATLSRLLLRSHLIQDLTGLEFAIKLSVLSLSGNEISDISALAALKNLEVLDLSHNQIWDISSLAGLKNLIVLSISNNWISDFSPIAHLIPNLETYENSDQAPLAVAVDPEAPVQIPDPVLRTAIEKELGKPPGTTITQAEMATLISFNSLESAGIHDIAAPGIQNLTGLEFAINLQTLKLGWILHIPTNTYRANRSISDVSPLANLHNLTHLDISHNQIWDVSPLANLHNLKGLDLSSNPISDISPLAGLKNLTWLDLSYIQKAVVVNTPRSDIASIAQLKNLQSLIFTNNRIADVSSIATLENLTVLDISHNQIWDVSPLAGLENLTNLSISYNWISDVSPLKTLGSLTWLDIDRNQITDVSSIAALENLKSLNLSDNWISDVSPLKALENLTWLDISRNAISDFSPIIHLIPKLNTYRNDNQSSLALVDIPDLNLRAAIERILRKPPGTAITQIDMYKLTSVNLSNGYIQDLTGLKFATNLTHLYLWNNQISDVSPLADLINLTSLDLTSNQISDVSPLADLINLTSLDLGNNQISDVSPLTQLKNLTLLDLGNNQISDFSAIAGLIPNLLNYDDRNQGVSQDPIHIPDSNLRAAIEIAIANAPGTTITEAEMLRLIDLEADEAGIQDLTGLEFATALEVLRLGSNQITDVSPLTGLENLTYLDLTRNQVSDVSFLIQHENLRWLDISHTQVSDVSPLAGLKDLRRLHLRGTQISDLSSLAGLIKLTYLNFQADHSPTSSKVSDLTPLAQLQNLTELRFSSSEVSDLTPLAQLQNLTELAISGSQLSDVSPLAGLVNLTELSLQDNLISDVSPLAGLVNLTELSLQDNLISDVSPLAGLVNLTRLSLLYNNISDFTPITGLKEAGVEIYTRGQGFVKIAQFIYPPLDTGVRVSVSGISLGKFKVRDGFGDWLTYTVTNKDGEPLQGIPIVLSAYLHLVPSNIASEVSFHPSTITTDSKGQAVTYIKIAQAGLFNLRADVKFSQKTVNQHGTTVYKHYDGYQTVLIKGLELSGVSQFTYNYTQFLPPRNGEHFKIYGQGNANTCGQTSARMLLSYYGVDVSLKTFDDVADIHTWIVGSTPTEMKDGLKLLPVDLETYSGTVEGYPRDKSLRDKISESRPPILVIRVGKNAYHHIVVVGYDTRTNSFLIADPAETGYFQWVPWVYLDPWWRLDFIRGYTWDEFWAEPNLNVLGSAAIAPDLKFVIQYFDGLDPYRMFVPKEAPPYHHLASETFEIYVTGPVNYDIGDIEWHDWEREKTVSGKVKAISWVGEFRKADIRETRMEGNKAIISGRIADGIPIDSNFPGPLYGSADIVLTVYYQHSSTAAAPSSIFSPQPIEMSLLPNYPNPFNPETWIPYHLAKPADVVLTIYSIDGQVVRRLDLGHKAAGFYQSRSRAAHWDGRNAVGERVASGLYFYTLTAGEFVATRKMLIRK